MKLISLNIEGNKHFDRVLPFIEGENADVICIQEIFENDIERFLAFGYTSTFLPMTIKPVDGISQIQGIAMCTRIPQKNIQQYYYSNDFEEIPTFNKNDINNTVMHGVILSDFEFKGSTFTIGTTHFTWTPAGESPCLEQQTDLDSFLLKIKEYAPHVMCGDFNIPRNINSLYQKLIQNYSDAIPSHYTSSLDKNLHRLGITPDAIRLFETFMVDYVFTQKPYIPKDVRLAFGISDHAAVVATIERMN
jgi:endonuclease/exonuclease/phosphatase family metal-dependent hydrolase